MTDTIIAPELRDLITSGPMAHLTTINRDGSPQVSVIWIGLDGDDVVSGHMTHTAKHRNIERDPRVVHRPGSWGRTRQLSIPRWTSMVDSDRGTAVRPFPPPTRCSLTVCPSVALPRVRLLLRERPRPPRKFRRIQPTRAKGPFARTSSTNQPLRQVTQPTEWPGDFRIQQLTDSQRATGP
ncbi:pyridoxamine 5'-phosphate oxidase family protein [Kibdelosporangium lantanae]|uniref:Pyridoxamine 5'-phosphate oxidase family protein n=1 Tax=Kibdelosporangium lantanae TaxID=1497396 RepID=A0ABW3MKP8_9PSEU